MAAKAGVMMGFETMETEFMNTVEKAMVYVNRVNSPYLNVYPDLGKCYQCGCNVWVQMWKRIWKPDGAIWLPCI